MSKQMTRYLSRRLLPLAAIATCIPLLATSSTAAAVTIYSPTTVSQIVTRVSDNTHLFLTGTTFSMEICASNDRAVIAAADAGAKSMLATVMLAMALGKQVEVAIDGCISTENSNFPKVYRVKIIS